MTDKFLAYLENRGWMAEADEKRELCLPEPMKSRYEWELLSLEAAGDDAGWKEEIRQFWDRHLPFFLSLDGGYAYYAFSMEDGSVVYGAEPEFEECETVADSFEDFMEKVMSGRIRL